jgi:hypothetical protein
MRELEHPVQEETGIMVKPLVAHPAGHTKSGGDGNDEKF